MQIVNTPVISKLVGRSVIALLISYLVLRVYCVDMTHDEAYSFFNVKHFWWVETLCTGNTHWFNFLAIKLAVLFGLEEVWTLRWLSLVCSIGYILVILNWIKSLRTPLLQSFAFAILCLNPFLFDYLGLARGYSTAIFLEVLCLMYYIKAIKSNNRFDFYKPLFLAGLAAISNFNFFYFFVAYGLCHANYFFKKDGIKAISNKYALIELCFSLGIIGIVIKALRFITVCSNDIGNFGGQAFVDSIFGSYLKTALYMRAMSGLTLPFILPFVLCTFILFMGFVGVFYFNQHKNHWYAIASKLMFVMFALMVFNKWVLQVLYPTERTLFILYPVVAWVVIGFLNYVTRWQMFKHMVMVLITSAITIIFLLNLNLGYTYDYFEQQDAKKAFVFLDSIKAKRVGVDPQLFGVYRNYYQFTEKHAFNFEGISIRTYLPKGIDITRHQLDSLDYLVLFPPYNLTYYQTNHFKCDTIKRFGATQTVIVKLSH